MVKLNHETDTARVVLIIKIIIIRQSGPNAGQANWKYISDIRVQLPLVRVPGIMPMSCGDHPLMWGPGSVKTCSHNEPLN